MDIELAEIRDFVADQPPFDLLDPGTLSLLPAKLASRYFRRGTRVIAAGDDAGDVYIVRSGAVERRDPNGELCDALATGSYFGVGSALEGHRARHDLTAVEDTLVFVVPGAVFRELVAEHPSFEEFFRTELTERLRRAVQNTQVSDRGEPVLKTKIGDLVRRAPLTVPASTTITEAAATMTREGVSSLLVIADRTGASKPPGGSAADSASRLVGIVTDKDLRSRVLAVGADPAAPISSIMTANPVTARAEAMAFELLLEMAQRNIHHAPVVDGGRLVGLVSAGDLLRLQTANPIFLAGRIAKQDTLDGLVAASTRLPQVVEQLVSEDAAADDIGRIVTGLGDAIERRLLALAEAELGPPPVPYCWMLLGSAARLEQGLSSDQDNALLLSDDATPEHDAYFAELARRVSDGLAACGYTYCRGEVMATNPRWRQPLAGWQRTFTGWLATPDPMAVMHSTIFYDMRGVHGDLTLLERLRGSVLEQTPHSPRFLTHLAGHAAARRPPIGFFRNFVLESEGEHADTLDLKKSGVAAIVELARVHALALGLPHVNTQSRLAAIAAAGRLGTDQTDDLRDALEFISFVRLRHQGRQVRAGQTPDNHVRPDELTNVERRHLRDVFGVVRRAQGVLASAYPTHYLS